MDDLFECDAIALAEQIKVGGVAAADMLSASVARAERLNPSLHAVVNFNTPQAEKLLATTALDTPLYGVPTLLKDLGAEAIDFPSHNGSRLYQDTVYSYDSSIYQRMRKTGLIPYARTTSPELGIGPTSEAGVYGAPTRNPWNVNHTSGGSSGGSGSAVAAGIVPLAHGSDGGGSVRIPAACCGLVGIKPTRARLPDGPAVGEGWAGMAIDGFLTRSVRDSALMLDHCSGADLGAPYSAPPLKTGFMKAMDAKLPGLRVAVLDTDFMGNAVHEECRHAVAQTADSLRQLGHHVSAWSSSLGDDVKDMMMAWTKIVAAGTLLSVRYKKDIAEVTPDDVDGVTYGAIQLGNRVSGADYLQSINTVHAFGRKMAHLFEDVDILLSPTLAEPPAEIGRFKPINTDFMDYRNGPDGVFAYSPYTAIFNASGQPAMSLPLHWTPDNLPVGVHFAAAYGNDEMLMSLARQLEQAMPWHAKQVDLIRQYHPQ
ncbi:MAG: 6-aminohexanoate hydrolase [Candidatus Puniceispirillum sp. TMED52]|nr:6-aminohexanoate hydrolase [SAR116 cluster bacterium]OUU49330.1 MAG: 6-aminohexanoate hydrolase [Candidatus Puniceispirillum sp. TMED52]HCP18070.1 amidase [Alphaproteobacteria bacterium]